MTISLSNKNWAGGGESSNFDKQVTQITCKDIGDDKTAIATLNGVNFRGSADRRDYLDNVIACYDGSFNESSKPIDIISGYDITQGSPAQLVSGGKYGDGISLTTTDRYMRISHVPRPNLATAETTGWTVGFWVNRNSWGSSNAYILGARTGDYKYFSVYFHWYQGLAFYITDANVNNDGNTTYTMPIEDYTEPTGVWFHICISFGLSNITVYVNGIQRGQVSWEPVDLRQYTGLRFGAYYDRSDYPYVMKSKVDDVKIINQEVNVEDVADMMLERGVAYDWIIAESLAESINASSDYVAEIVSDSTNKVQVTSVSNTPYTISLNNYLESYEIFPKNFVEMTESTENELVSIQNEISYIQGPITPTSTGIKGQWSYDSTSSQIFRCVDDDTWVRYIADTDW